MREANGRVSRRAVHQEPDPGSSDLRRHRREAHGMDWVSTEHPIDVLAAQRLLTGSDEDADLNTVRAGHAARFALYYQLVLGTPHPRSLDAANWTAVFGEVEPAAPPPETPGARAVPTLSDLTPPQRERHAELTLRRMMAAVDGAGAGVLGCLITHAVHCRPVPAAGAARDAILGMLRVALTALDDVRPVKFEEIEHKREGAYE